MPIGRNLYTNLTITQSAAGQSVAVPVGDVDFIVAGITVQAISAGTTADMFIQWSFDGSVWSDALGDPEDTISSFTAPGTRMKRIPIKAPYWRVAAKLTGTSPSVTLTANALVW